MVDLVLMGNKSRAAIWHKAFLAVKFSIFNTRYTFFEIQKALKPDFEIIIATITNDCNNV